MKTKSDTLRQMLIKAKEIDELESRLWLMCTEEEWGKLNEIEKLIESLFYEIGIARCVIND